MPRIWCMPTKPLLWVHAFQIIAEIVISFPLSWLTANDNWWLKIWPKMSHRMITGTKCEHENDCQFWSLFKSNCFSGGDLNPPQSQNLHKVHLVNGSGRNDWRWPIEEHGHNYFHLTTKECAGLEKLGAYDLDWTFLFWNFPGKADKQSDP